MSDPTLLQASERWFAEWFDRDYLLLYGHRDRDDARRGVELLERVVAPAPGAPILDLACGAGRHARQLADRGFRVTGLDLSAVLLGQAALETAGQVALVRADMRQIPLRSASFAVCLSFFTSFGYFDDEDNSRVLAEVARVLRPGGVLLLDTVNREPTLRHLDQESRRRIGRLAIRERRSYDEASRRLVKVIDIEDGEDTRHRIESVLLYDPEELAARVAAAPLVVERLLGDLDGEPFDRNRSPRLIVLARKP